MKIINLLFLLIFSLFISPAIIFSQNTQHTIEDYGLTQEDVKFLSQEEIQDILNSKTPKETLEEEKLKVEQSGTPEAIEAFNNPQPVNRGFLDNTVNCFDYYKFGSVQTTLTAQSFDFIAGDTIDFSGPITNENDYPIVSGTLYVKIFRTNGTIKDGNGPDVVDQFVAADNITIPANEQTNVSFSWKVPLNSKSGDYKVVSYFTVDKKFNLLGLTFTDDVIGNTFNFKIIGKGNNVQFDKSGIVINKKAYFFAAYPPRISIDNVANVSAKVNNSTNKDETVDIIWNLYRWDAMTDSNLIRTSSEKITVNANSSAIVKIGVPESEEPVYYLIGELKYKDSKSIIGVRFVRPEIDRIRLNFPSITSFPIKSGLITTMFSCLHNSGISQIVSNAKLNIKITDTNNKIIEEYTYEGQVTGDMMAVKKDFTPSKNIDHFFLTAQLWQSNKLVDQSTIEYDCNKINPKLCNPKISLTKILIILLILMIIIAIIIGTTIFINKKTKK